MTTLSMKDGASIAVGAKIGEGSFSAVFLGRMTRGHRVHHVALKIERYTEKKPQLRREFKVYKMLKHLKGFAQAYYFRSRGDQLTNIIVMDLLGPTLEELFHHCGRKFSLKTALQVADQMMEVRFRRSRTYASV